MNNARRHRTRWVAVAVVVLVGVGAAFAGGSLGERHTSDVPSPASSTSTAASITQAPSDDAAVEIALRYVAVTGDLLSRSPVGRRELLRHLVVADQVEVQAAALDTTAREMTAKLGSPVEHYAWIEAPLTATRAPVDATGAVRVSVWTVSVFASADSPTVEQIWRTVHVTLAPSGSTWLVSAAESEAGPVPTPNELALPSPVEEFLTVARWVPAVAHESL